MRLLRAVYEALPADDAFIPWMRSSTMPVRDNVRGPLTVLNVTGCDPRRAFDQGQAPQSAW